MSDRVVVNVVDGVADVRLNRPDKLNALDNAMFQALVETGVELARNRALRAVVLSGEGRAFCAGLDFASFTAMSSAASEAGGSSGADSKRSQRERAQRGEAERSQQIRDSSATSLLARDAAESPANFAQRAAWVWTELPVPVIAAVHGVAFGGGFQLTLGADMRFLSPDARMSIMEIKWGLIPDMAGTPILASLVRDDILRDLTYTGRIFSAQEALAYGLATRICDDPRAAAFEVAREIAGKSPDAIRAAKRLLNKLSVDPGPALLAESVEQQKLIGSVNQLEAVRANIEKRAAKFSDA